MGAPEPHVHWILILAPSYSLEKDKVVLAQRGVERIAYDGSHDVTVT